MKEERGSSHKLAGNNEIKYLSSHKQLPKQLQAASVRYIHNLSRKKTCNEPSSGLSPRYCSAKWQFGGSHRQYTCNMLSNNYDDDSVFVLCAVSAIV